MDENRQFEDNNTIIELTPVQEDTLYDEKPVENITVETKEGLVVKKKLPKKTIIIIICACIGVVLLIAIGILLFSIIGNDEPENPVDENPAVVIAKDNYIYENGVLKLLGETDIEIGTYTCINQDAEECYVAAFDGEDTFDTPKYVYQNNDPVIMHSQIYNNNYVFIYDDGKVLLYDITNKETLGEYKLVKKGNINKNIFVVRNLSNDYGLIEITDEGLVQLIDFEHDYLGIVASEESFVVKDAINSYLINNKGKAISDKVKGDIKSFNDKYIAVYDEKYKLYDYSGDLVFDETYEFIDLSGDYVILVQDSKLYFYTNDLIKLNEEGYKLKKDDYVETHVYNDNKEFKETRKAYGITSINGILTIDITDSVTKTLNTYEGIINETIDYVNYFDGVLYFYSDKEKTEEIGIYYCNNKNNVASITDKFESCFIAMDSNIINANIELGYIPIFNNNYVFIKDSTAGSSIILYDLKNSKNVSKYSAIDSGIGMETVSYITSINAPIAAKNTSGAYGIITFGSDGPESIIRFSEDGQNTTKIEAFKDTYYIVTRNKVNYLYTKQGVYTEESSQFEIVDYVYNYLVVKNSGKYLIYDDGKILSDNLDYVKLNKDYYVGIKDNKFNIYSYSDTKKALLNESLAISNNDLANSYLIKKVGSENIITIIDQDGTETDYKYHLDWSKVEEVIPEPTPEETPEENPEDTPLENEGAIDNGEE